MGLVTIGAIELPWWRSHLSYFSSLKILACWRGQRRLGGAACAQQGQSKRGTTKSYNGERTRKTGSYKQSAALPVHNLDNQNEQQMEVTTENGRGRLAHTSSQRRCLCTTGTIETRNNWKLQRRTDEEDWLILQAVQRGTIENRWHIYKPKNILLYYISIYTQQEAINTVLIDALREKLVIYIPIRAHNNTRTTGPRPVIEAQIKAAIRKLWNHKEPIGPQRACQQSSTNLEMIQTHNFIYKTTTHTTRSNKRLPETRKPHKSDGNAA